MSWHETKTFVRTCRGMQVTQLTPWSRVLPKKHIHKSLPPVPILSQIEPVQRNAMQLKTKIFKTFSRNLNYFGLSSCKHSAGIPGSFHKHTDTNSCVFIYILLYFSCLSFSWSTFPTETRFSPLRTKSSAVYFPIPQLAPVIMATFPSSRFELSQLLCLDHISLST